MADVLVCVKRVPDSSGEVVLTEDAQAVDGRYAGFTMSPHEECAVELAVQIAAATGGEATVLTLGAADAVEQLRSALAVGCHAATLVDGRAPTFGPADVAREIAAVVRAHEAEGRAHDLVLLGNDAADTRRLPGRDPARLRARPSGGQRRQGGLGRGRHRHRPGRGAGRRRDLPGPAAGGGDDPRGRRRAALPERAGPDEGQEGGGRGAHRRARSRPGRSG